MLSYERRLQTKAGEVMLSVPKLRNLPIETAIIEGYRRRESSVEVALIEMSGWGGMRRHGKRSTAKQKRPKTRLGLPDLDHSKTAVLDSLRSRESKRGYRQAMDEFIQWYCSEPRLSFNKIVVTRFRIFLENRNLAAGTINGRLAAVRRLAYEAADAGLLSPELAAGIRRVKGVKKLGVRLGCDFTKERLKQEANSHEHQMHDQSTNTTKPG